MPWWYRKSFTVPASFKRPDGTIWLRFEALNYRANVWLNGQQIGQATDLAGAWRRFELNVTRGDQAGRQPTCWRCEVFPQQKEDLGITFVDWNPTPPDKNMGLWREVYLSASGPLALRHPAVLSTVDRRPTTTPA